MAEEAHAHPVSLERIQWLQAVIEENDRRMLAHIDGIRNEMTVLKEFDTHRFAERAAWVAELSDRLRETVTSNDQRYTERWQAQQEKMAEADRRLQQRFDAQQLAIQDALVAQEKSVSAALTAADRAVAKAEVASEKRFDSVNEFRATLADQANGLMPRGEAEAKLASINDRIVELSRLTERNEGKGIGQGMVVVYIFGALASMAGLASVVIGIVKP